MEFLKCTCVVDYMARPILRMFYTRMNVVELFSGSNAASDFCNTAEKHLSIFRKN